jgi:hypothetical protein
MFLPILSSVFSVSFSPVFLSFLLLFIFIYFMNFPSPCGRPLPSIHLLGIFYPHNAACCHGNDRRPTECFSSHLGKGFWREPLQVSLLLVYSTRFNLRNWEAEFRRHSWRPRGLKCGSNRLCFIHFFSIPFIQRVPLHYFFIISIRCLAFVTRLYS